MAQCIALEPVAAVARRRKIAIVCSYTISLVNFRYRLLKALTGCGYDVVAFGPEDHRPTIDALAEIGVGFVRVPMARSGLSPLGDLRTLLALCIELRRLSPDMVICYTMKPIIYGLIAARIAGIRQRHALVTGLGYVFSDDDANPRLPLIRGVATWLYRRAFHGDGRVFVYNDADANDIRAGRMVRDPGRVVRVPGSGVDLDHFTASLPCAGETIFLMVARLLKDKGPLEFVEAARRLRMRHPHVRFQILGRPDPGPLGVPPGEIEQWRRDGVVEYLGETDDVRPYLAACTVFVLPSYYREGIPRSILEAMATGRAIITTDMPGCRDTVAEGENGFLVKARDVTGLAAAMETFVTDPSLAVRMGQRSVEIARQRFDVETVNRRLLSEMGIVAGV